MTGRGDRGLNIHFILEDSEEKDSFFFFEDLFDRLIRSVQI